MRIRDVKIEAKEVLSNGKKELLNAAMCILLLTCLSSLIESLNINVSEWIILLIGIFILIIERGFQFSLTKMHVKRKNNEEIKVSDVFVDGFKELRKSWSITFGIIPKFIIPIICSIVIVLISLFLSYLMKDIIIENNQVSIESFYDLTEDEPEIEKIRLNVFGVSFKDLDTLEKILCIIGVILYVYTLTQSILLTYKYRYADIEAIENPELSTREIIEKSGEIMEGNRMKSFILDLSFMPIILLTFLVLWFICGFLLVTMFFIIISSRVIGMLVCYAILLLLLSYIIARIQINLLMAHIVFYDDLKSTSYDAFNQNEC